MASSAIPKLTQKLIQKLKTIAFGLGVVVGALFLSSCSRTSDQQQSSESLRGAEDLEANATFTAVYTRTLAIACVECHNPSGMATVNYNVQLNFADRSAAYTTLLVSTVNGVTSTGTCAPVRVVAPGNPKTSYLLGTLIQAYSTPNFGGVANCTPYAGHFQLLNLSAEQKSSMVNWILAGALDN